MIKTNHPQRISKSHVFYRKHELLSIYLLFLYVWLHGQNHYRYFMVFFSRQVSMRQWSHALHFTAKINVLETQCLNKLCKVIYMCFHRQLSYADVINKSRVCYINGMTIDDGKPICRLHIGRLSVVHTILYPQNYNGFIYMLPHTYSMSFSLAMDIFSH